MPVRFEFGKVELSTEGRPQPAAPVASDGDRPFRIGILGDFRGHRGDSATTARVPGPPIPVDRDTLDAVMARLDVGLNLAHPDQELELVELVFRSLDDFHPDQLLATGFFRSLREARRRLADPATFLAAATELGFLQSLEPEPAPPPAPTPPPRATPGGPELLEQIFKRSTSRSPGRAGDDPAWQAYLDRITAPHVERRDGRQDEVVAGIDATIAALLRDVLHQPEFQALEATWRGVDRLTRALETGAELTIELIDTTCAGLEAELLASTPLESTAAYQKLVEETVGTEGGEPWALLVGLFTFEPTIRDVVLLWRLGQLGRLAGAPVLAAASPRFVGCNDLAATPSPDEWNAVPEIDGWADLRQSEEAPYVGLALPRWILRVPYGKESAPIDTFAFEEIEGTPVHDDYLWGHPGLAVAQAIGQAFNASGWSWHRSYDPAIGDLPLPLERVAGESTTKPCAETLLGQRAVDRLLAAGLIPLVSVRHRDAIQVAQLRSIADPPTALAVRSD